MPRTQRAATRGFGRNGSLNRLMQKVQTRELGDSRARRPSTTGRRRRSRSRPSGRWRRRPSPRPGQAAATLAGGVKLEGHPAPQGQGPAGDRAPLDARPGQHHAPSAALRRPERLPALDVHRQPGHRPRAQRPGADRRERPVGRHPRGAAPDDRPAGASSQRARGPRRLRRRVLPAARPGRKPIRGRRP